MVDAAFSTVVSANVVGAGVVLLGAAGSGVVVVLPSKKISVVVGANVVTAGLHRPHMAGHCARIRPLLHNLAPFELLQLLASSTVQTGTADVDGSMVLVSVVAADVETRTPVVDTAVVVRAGPAVEVVATATSGRHRPHMAGQCARMLAPTSLLLHNCGSQRAPQLLASSTVQTGTAIVEILVLVKESGLGDAGVSSPMFSTAAAVTDWIENV